MSEPIRVLFAVPEYPPPVRGGLERQAAELARSLAERGATVTVLSKRFDAGQPAEERDAGVRVIRVDPSNPLAEAAALTRRMVSLRGQFDVVHLHNVSWFGVPIIAAARALGRPVLAKLPSYGVWGIQGQMERRFGRVWLAAFRRADAVVALSDESVNELDGVGYPRERVFRATNGVSTERFRPGARGGADRVEFVYVGRLDPLKGIGDLLEVWGGVVKAAPRARLRIFGEGPMGAELRASIERLGLGASVRMEGHAADVAEVLGAADVFVLPSYGEGNSNAVLEAMAAGLPVVSTLAGGTPRLVGSPGRPWLVAPGDRAALGRTLSALAADAGLRARAGEAMRTRALDAFAIERIAEQYERVYRLLIGGERGRVAEVHSPVWGERGAAG